MDNPFLGQIEVNMKKAVKIVKSILNVFCWIIVLVMVFAMLTSIVTQMTGGTPEFFGYSIYRVSSGSMEPELKIGDVILDETVKNPKELEVGDIVTYIGTGELEGKMVTHEVIEAPYTEDGVLMLQTQGTANPIPDAPIEAARVKGLFVCELPVLTFIYGIFFSKWGFLAIIALVAFIFIDEIITIIKTLTGHGETEKKAESIDEIISRIKSDEADGERKE